MTYLGDESGFSVAVKKINRDSPVQDLVFTRSFWGLRVDREVMEAIPRGEGDETKIRFVRISHVMGKIDRREISIDELSQLCADEGFRFADPRAYLTMQAEDFDFANRSCTTTFWKHNGEWCSAAVGRSYGLRYTYIVYCTDSGKEYRITSPALEWVALEAL